jgi:hypothetical protein
MEEEERPSAGQVLVRLAGIAWFATATVLRSLFVIWLRLPPRARVISALATLVVMAAMVGGVSPAAGAILQALAVLLLAGIGFAMILRAPFRRRL